MTIFEKQKTLSLTDILDEAIVVQDYPEKYSSIRGKPRVHHESYKSATSKGFIYGLRLDSQKHWTRFIMLKPSKALLEHMEKHITTKIDAIFFNQAATDSSKYLACATYLNGIGETVICSIDRKALEEIKIKAWKLELGASVL